MTRYPVVCPSCKQTYWSNLQRDRSCEFYSGRPWVCLWCRMQPVGREGE